MSAPKQIIVMRTDLKMRKGKMIAQGAHASMAVVVKYLTLQEVGPDSYPEDEVPHASGSIPRTVYEWLNGAFTKVCVRAESEEELLDLYQRAKARLIPCALITDSGRTEFGGVPTNTCCAIGPAYPEDLDPITGHLKLL